jgi:hypothetical protein
MGLTISWGVWVWVGGQGRREGVLHHPQHLNNRHASGAAHGMQVQVLALQAAAQQHVHVHPELCMAPLEAHWHMGISSHCAAVPPLQALPQH